MDTIGNTMSTSLDKRSDGISSPTEGAKKSYSDDTYRADLDKTGNGYAVVRFLPTPKTKKC